MQRSDRTQQLARIRVVGIGTGGRTAVNRMLASGTIKGVEYVAVDTDIEALHESNAALDICISEESSRGRGAAGDVKRGKRAALSSTEVLRSALYGSDLVFIAAGLGGGTGTGAAPVVAQIARQENALVIGIVTYPFSFEGETRAAIAEKGIRTLRDCTDTLIVIPNDRLIQMAGGAIGFHETYRLAHDIWHQSIKGVSDLVNRSGLINVDFADVRAIMSEGGAAVIAAGHGTGPGRAQEAAQAATHSELLGITIDGAHGVLFNISGGPDMSLLEVEEAAEVITRRAHPNANVIFGAAVDADRGDEIHITVIATGFGFAETRTSSWMRSRKRPWRLEPIPLRESRISHR
jgi:cell division protein FtsZ